MNDPANQPETLVSVPNEFEAAMIVSALAARDIDASTSGSFTAGFRAEAPGDVEVVVRQRDLERAKIALEELRPHTAQKSPQQHGSLTLSQAAGIQTWQAFGLLALLAAAVLYLWR